MGKKKTAPESRSEKPQGTAETEQKRLNTEKKRRFAKIYREYSRRQYKKYRLQFPKLRESDIVDKIIKEWEAFSQEEKMQLQKKYIEIGGDQFMKDGSKSKSSNSKSKPGSGSGSAGSQAKREQQVKKEDGAEPAQSQPKKKKPSPKVRVFVEKATDRNRNFMDDSDFKKDQAEKQEPSDNESIQINVQGQKKKVPRKTKKIKKEKLEKETKRKESEYLTFFKYYYSRLSSEHPRWTSGEITTIIKLLWKKRSMTPHRKQRKTIIDGTFKPVSGRVMYRREKQANGLNIEQIKLLWKLLPFQSKKYWQKRGRGGSELKKLPEGALGKLKRTMKKGSESQGVQKDNKLTWMSYPISTR